MAIINLHNGLEGHDYSADEVRAEGNSRFVRPMHKQWDEIVSLMNETARESVHTQVEDDTPKMEFLARYLEHPAATDVVLG